MDKFIEKILKNIYSDNEYNKEYSKIYKIHKYWARKPWYIVDEYIEKYSKENDYIMDPFCGSGCTGVEATCYGRNFIGYDLNPTAIAVSNATIIKNINIAALRMDCELLKNKCMRKIQELYKVEDKCEKCDSNLYIKYGLIGPKYNNKRVLALYCPNCSGDRLIKKREITEKDEEKINSIENKKIPYWYPEVEFPKKFYKDRFSYKGISRVSDMYTNRNLYALALLLDEIKKLKEPNKSLILMAFSNTVLHASKLKGENVRPLGVNNYWIPDDYIEENVWFRFQDRLKNMLLSKEKLEEKVKALNIKSGDYKIEKKSAINLKEKNQIDYVFTDPPYGEAIQYSELSYIWNAWFENIYDIKEEIIINPVQNKKKEQFNNLLFKSISNIYTALKNEKYFTLCFQNKDFSIWKDIINYCKSIGFVLYEIGIYDTFGSSFNKNWAKFSPKTDIYVTFKKTNKINEKNYFNKKLDIDETIVEIIKYFNKHKSLEFDNVRLYDITIAYIIWNIFYNKENIDIDNFNTKTFCKKVEEIMDNKYKREQKGNKNVFKQLSLFVNAE